MGKGHGKHFSLFFFEIKQESLQPSLYVITGTYIRYSSESILTTMIRMTDKRNLKRGLHSVKNVIVLLNDRTI